MTGAFCAQLEKLDEYIAIKRRIAETYVTSLRGVSGLTPMRAAKWAFSIFWMFTMLVDEKKYGITSRELLRQAGNNRNDSEINFMQTRLNRAKQLRQRATRIFNTCPPSRPP